MKNIIKRILAIWISVYLIVIPPFAHAVSPAGWAFSKYDVATSVVTALKNGVSASVAVAKSPITTKIAKGIVGGVIAGAAIPLSISQISGIALTAVDWALDPENNAIKYKDNSISDGSYQYRVKNRVSVWSSTKEAACIAAIPIFNALNNTTYTFVKIYSDTQCQYNSPQLGNLYQNLESSQYTSEWKSIPISTVADKIYDNAKTDSNSRSVVSDAVRDYVNEGSADTALDNAKADADATHGCGTGTHWSGSACVADTPSTPTTPTTPDTPFDPSSIIDAIKGVFDAVMSLPDVINNALDSLLVDIKDFFQPVVDSVTNFFDWVKTTYDEFVKPDNTPTDVDVNVPQTQTIDTDINFGGSCPANVTGSFVIGGRTTTFNIMDWSQFCLIMSTYLKYLVIAYASYEAIKILAGRK